jgi:hypothetical protein
VKSNDNTTNQDKMLWGFQFQADSESLNVCYLLFIVFYCLNTRLGLRMYVAHKPSPLNPLFVQVLGTKVKFPERPALAYQAFRVEVKGMFVAQ